VLPIAIVVAVVIAVVVVRKAEAGDLQERALADAAMLRLT